MARGLFPPGNWPHRTWLALLHTGDNHGPPRPEEVKQVLDQVAQRMPGVKVRIGRLSDFGDAILAENPDLPVVGGLGRAHQLFGESLPALLDELNTTLAA